MRSHLLVRIAPLLAALVVSGPLAGPAAASPTHEKSDPKGDYPLAEGDIASIKLSKVVRNDLTLLQIDLTIVGPLGNFAYGVGFKVGGCPVRFVAFSDGNKYSGCYANDVDSQTFTGSASRKGSVITFTVALRKLPMGGDLKPGAQLTGIGADTTPGGYYASAQGATVVGDTLKAGDWKVP